MEDLAKYLDGKIKYELKKFSGVVAVERVRINREGYNEMGRYFGYIPGSNVYRLDFDDEGNWGWLTGEFRARDLTTARAMVKAFAPKARVK